MFLILGLMFFAQLVEPQVTDELQNNQFYNERFECPTTDWTLRCEKCFLFVDDEKQWSDAEYYCKQQGSHLVSVHDLGTNTFLSRYVVYKSNSARTVWIGLNDRDKENNFIWSDGSESSKYEYRWLPGEPKNTLPGENCVEMFVRSKQYMWNDVRCNKPLPFVCQTKACIKGSFRCDNGKCIPKKAVCDGLNDCTDSSDERQCSNCNTHFTKDSGNFTSNNFPVAYSNNLKCTWTIHVKRGYRIQLNFTYFDLEAGFDHVVVFDGLTTASTMLGRYTGKKSFVSVTSTSNRMLVMFVSDESDAFSGFSASYNSIKKECGSSELTLRPNDVKFISSPNYPENYNDESTCIWTIKNSDKYNILSFQIIDISTEQNNDLIDVRNQNSNGYLLGQFSGFKIPQPVFSTKDSLWVKFQSDFKNNMRGFRAKIQSGCLASYNSSYGIIASPGFGFENYMNQLECVWNVTEPFGRSISFIFHQFDTEEKYDVVTVSSQGVLLKRYSGSKTKDDLSEWMLHTNTANASVTFKTDLTYVLKGFNASFSIGCGYVPSVNNGTVSGESHYGGVAVYECDPYYILANGNKQTCQYGGRWSQPKPFCKVIDCGYPGQLENGSFSVYPANHIGYIFNTIVEYFCNPGYRLVGQSERRCLANETWSGLQPTCQISICTNPGVPQNGSRIGDDFDMGVSVMFECDEGFNLKGQAKLTCGGFGKWSAPTPTCQPITCKLATPPEHGVFEGVANNTRFSFHHLLNITCAKGYRLLGNKSIRCEAPGAWKPTIFPTCVDVNECQQQNISPCKGNGSVCVNTLGSFKCVCRDGFESIDPLTCKDIDECVSNSTLQCEQKCINEMGSYKCACWDGYFLYKGNRSQLSQIELRTAVEDHSCFGKSCPVPPIPEKGYLLNNKGHRFPVTLEYGCEDGWILDSMDKPQCQKNGTWKHPFPQCISSICHQPENVTNSEHIIKGVVGNTGDTYRQGSLVTYRCLAGFERKSGNLVRECIRNRTAIYWSGELPTCSRISCNVTAPTNGGVEHNGTFVGDILKYTCNGGFVMIGNSTARCKINGRWSGFIPVCAAFPCPDPGTPTNGKRTGNLVVGETVTYNCTRNGYELVGSANRTCVYMGEGKGVVWTGALPICKDVMPPVIDCSRQTYNYTLPRFESQMLIDWQVPDVWSDNSGKQLNLSGPSSPPMYVAAGTHVFPYVVADEEGNKAFCNVTISVKDNEKPRLRCPKNIVIESQMDTVVFWDTGVFTDNVGVASVVYSPPNGTIFASNKRHKVQATVTDVNGNTDTCVMEVYVKGCGCADQQCRLKPYEGYSTCHINKLREVWAISCNFFCNKTKEHSFVDRNYHGETQHCNPHTGWPRSTIPGCAERKPITTCANITMETSFSNSTVIYGRGYNLTGYAVSALKELADTCRDHGIKFRILDSAYVSSWLSSVTFQMTPPENTIDIAGILDACSQKIKTVKLQKTILDIASQTYNGTALNVSVTSRSCCDNAKGYCCPDGHWLNDLHQGSYICLACSPGMYHNTTLNKCLSCPMGTYTPGSAYSQCLPCPRGSYTLSNQSTSCSKYCSPGTFSSNGFEPACRKCDYAEYQDKSGATNCKQCATNTTTDNRGSHNITYCKERCPPGEISSNGLQPCKKCEKGFYQDSSMKVVCKKCEKNGSFGGVEGATSSSECPTNNTCDLDRCKNNASCIQGNFSTYTCICPAGWSGKHCDVDIDECMSLPCGNYGNCTDKVNGYTCTCLDGYTGEHCDVNIDDCANVTCLNQGVCEDRRNDFKCLCPAGYTGKRCEIDIDECKNDPCFNNGTCIDWIGSFQCRCTSGFEGVRCLNETDECAVEPCLNNATCIDLFADFKCDCQPGFTGNLCGVDINECSKQPCRNNATCIDVINGYQCQCKEGFTGANCTKNINECEFQPCLNNASCIDGVNNYTCECAAGYHGDNCEFETNECASDPCRHNSTCLDKLNDYMCVCPFGYSGKQCENNTDDCYQDPCQNNATCHDLIGDYRCSCTPGYSGRNCSIVIDNCVSRPCMNQANCTNQVNNYTCECDSGFTGRNCELEINECQPDPCGGNSKNCTDLLDDFFCYCKDGYRGKNCSESYGYCEPNPCDHGSMCIDDYVNKTFTCNCTDGYYGDRCQNEIDECSAEPCQNGGVCTDLIADYNCACAKGFTGVNCETNIDDCVNVTCQNGGSCMDKLNGYQCKCLITYVGQHCEKRISNEVDIDFMGGAESYIKYSTVQNITRFVLSVWVRYQAQSNGTFLSIHHGNNGSTGIVSIDERSVSVDQQQVVSLASNINDGHWHHMVVNLTEQSSEIYQDGKKVASGITRARSNVTSFNGVLRLGYNFVDQSNDFIGQISQLTVWNDVQMKQINNCSVNVTGSLIPWLDLLNYAGSDVNIVRPWSCGKNVCPAGITGKFCETKIDKIPPNNTYCPPSRKIFATEENIEVNWREPTFEDNIGVVSVNASHISGQSFQWGDHVITYVAKDGYGNSAVCSFDLYVTGFNCSDLTFSTNSIHACGDWRWGRFCNYECYPDYEVAVPKPPYYSCGKDGGWSHGPPNFPDNPANLLPLCMNTTTPFTSSRNTFVYSTPSSCDENFKQTFLVKFKQLITELHQNFGICGKQECNFDTIQLKCKGDSRKRRDISSSNHEVEVTFETAGDVQMQQYLMRQLKENSTRFNVTGSVLLAKKVILGDLKATCTQGSIVKDAKCVLCPPGTYENGRTCMLCQRGTYSGPGATQCYPCGKGTTTLHEGSQTKDACVMECDLGTEYRDGRCMDCLKGYYRNHSNIAQCLRCANGLTTYVLGNKDGRCKAQCPVGSEVSQQENYQFCQKCDFAYYRSDLDQMKCKRCPTDHVTRGMGASSVSQCKERPVDAITYDVSVKFVSLKWSEPLTDRNSLQFRQQALNMTQSISSLYERSSLSYVQVVRLTKGSVVAMLELSFELNGTNSDPISTLREALRSGDVSGMEVDARNYTIDGCKRYNGCVKNEHCKYINNKRTCQCDQGFYKGGDGTCLDDCFDGYCLNDGQCTAIDSGRVCRCPAEYKGLRCEQANEGEEKHIWIIVVAVLGVVIFVVVMVVCLIRYKKNSSKSKQYGAVPLTNDSEVNAHPLQHLNETELTQPEKHSVAESSMKESTTMQSILEVHRKDEDEEVAETTPLSFENKGADLQEAPKNETVKAMSDVTGDVVVIVTDEDGPVANGGSGGTKADKHDDDSKNNNPFVTMI